MRLLAAHAVLSASSPCDLVGFTSRAEPMDPEDVEALLAPYHERLRSERERHGGTVEKFIGNAVIAQFGAPTAHELRLE